MRFDLRSGLSDIARAVQLSPLWFHVSLLEIRNRYRGSLIGPFWISLTTLSMILGMGILYAGLFKQNTQEYIPYLAVSLTLWNFMISFVTDSPRIFLDNASKLRGVSLPVSYYIFKHISVSILVFLHNIFALLAVYAYYQWPINVEIIWIIPGIALWVWTGFFIALLISIVTIRFRDLTPIILSLMQLAFFVTPIIWKAKDNKIAAQINLFNPFYYYIEVLRAPLFGERPQVFEISVCIGIGIVSSIVAVFVLSRFGKRVVFWL
jgi:lipopolysaccharide transport system permease protein